MGAAAVSLSPGLGWTAGEEGHIVDRRNAGADLLDEHANSWRAGLEFGGTN